MIKQAPPYVLITIILSSYAAQEAQAANNGDYQKPALVIKKSAFTPSQTEKRYNAREIIYKVLRQNKLCNKILNNTEEIEKGINNLLENKTFLNGRHPCGYHSIGYFFNSIIEDFVCNTEEQLTRLYSKKYQQEIKSLYAANQSVIEEFVNQLIIKFIINYIDNMNEFVNNPKEALKENQKIKELPIIIKNYLPFLNFVHEQCTQNPQYAKGLLARIRRYKPI